MACHGTLDERLLQHNGFHKILGNYAYIVNLFYRAISAYVFWHCKSIYHKHNTWEILDIRSSLVHAKPIAGIIFGLVFWSISRKIDKTATKEYLLIAGFGMMLLIASNQTAGLSLTPLPLFGIFTAAFFGLSSYLMFTGLYSSAVSVSHDLTLRKQARAYAKQLILLDNIGTPEMKKNIESLVSRAMKDLKNKVTRSSRE